MPVLTYFDPNRASDSYFKARHAFLSACQLEEMPEDTLASLEASILDAKHWHFFKKEQFLVWHCWEGNGIIAELLVNIAFYEHNRHMMWVKLAVLPAYRRQGHSQALLAKLVEIAETHHRTLLTVNTSSRVPSGEGFVKHLGARVGIENHRNQLLLVEVNPALLEQWIVNAQSTAKEFELGFMTDHPEGKLAAIAALIEVMNTEPRDNLEVEDWTVEPELLREENAYNQACGIERWMVYARHKPTGELAGFTCTYWNPGQPDILTQAGTGVLPKYRGYGLGKWLKATMLQKVLQNRSTVKKIRAGNAASNAPMLSINRQLGFKPYNSEVIWQLKVDKIKAYLKAN